MFGGIFQRARPPGSASACRTLAYFCTLIQLCLYAAPVILCLQMAMDTDVVYWIGGFGKWVLVVPLYTLLLHWVHIRQITANRQTRAIFGFMIVPMIFLCITGSWYTVPAARIKAGLFSAECSGKGLERKLELQQAYDQALEVYNICADRMRREGSIDTTFRHVTLPMCKEWFLNANGTNPSVVVPRSGYSKDRVRDFNYLAAAEAEHVCGGFCLPGPSLWTGFGELGREGSTCAPLVATKFMTIGRRAEMIFWTSFINCLIMLFSYLYARPLFERLGYDGDGID